MSKLTFRGKILQHHVDILASCVLDGLHKLSIDTFNTPPDENREVAYNALLQHYVKNSIGRDHEQRLMWDLVWSSHPNKNVICEMLQEICSNGSNDDNTTSALRFICKHISTYN